jgi:hypothetical protein
MRTAVRPTPRGAPALAAHGRAGTCDPLPLPLLKHTLAHTCTKTPPKTHTKHTLARTHHHRRGYGAPTHLEGLPAVRPQPQHQLPHALVAHVDRGDHGVDLRMRRGAEGGVPGCAQAWPGVGCTGVGCTGVGCTGVGCTGVGCTGVGFTGVLGAALGGWMQLGGCSWAWVVPGVGGAGRPPMRNVGCAL